MYLHSIFKNNVYKVFWQTKEEQDTQEDNRTSNSQAKDKQQQIKI